MKNKKTSLRRVAAVAVLCLHFPLAQAAAQQTEPFDGRGIAPLPAIDLRVLRGPDAPSQKVAPVVRGMALALPPWTVDRPLHDALAAPPAGLLAYWPAATPPAPGYDPPQAASGPGPSAAPQTLAQPSPPVLPPLDASGRLRWFFSSTFGVSSLAAGAVVAGWGTLFDLPEEYDTHWSGFGKRFAQHTVGVATSNSMEATLGAVWGEDPRYIGHPGLPFGQRVWKVLGGAFTARDSDGRAMPAYARYVAYPGSNFLSNIWRPDSEATTGSALLRTGYAFLSRIGSNAFAEFWPDIRQRLP